MKYFLISAIFFVSSAGFSAQNEVYHYKPETVELSGVIEIQTFPGRPGYYSIKDGDEIESCWYFKLSSPIDVDLVSNNEDGNAQPEKNVKVIQLAPYSDEMKDALDKLIGKKVILKGQLFHALSAHHHARTLMDVDAVRAAVE